MIVVTFTTLRIKGIDANCQQNNYKLNKFHVLLYTFHLLKNLTPHCVTVSCFFHRMSCDVTKYNFVNCNKQALDGYLCR